MSKNMLKEKFQKFKEKLEVKEGKEGNKKIENMVVFVLILIVTIVAINYILSNDKSTNKSNLSSEGRTLAQSSNEEKQTNSIQENSNASDIETRLENILSNIKGVGNVKVLITYSQESTIIPMYDEDTTTSSTEEKDSGGGTRTVNETSSKKDIIYEENDGVKTPITQSVINPTIEGAIITAQGATDATVKSNIVQAVEAVTGLATYKIQVFEMQ